MAAGNILFLEFQLLLVGEAWTENTGADSKCKGQGHRLEHKEQLPVNRVVRWEHVSPSCQGTAVSGEIWGREDSVIRG